MLERQSGGLVQIEVEEEEADDQLAVVLYELGNRLTGVPLDQLDLGDVPQVPVLIKQPDEAVELVEGVRREVALPGRDHGVLVLGVRGGEALKRVESVDPPGQIGGFQDRAQLGPAHQAESSEDTTFDNGSLHGEDPLEDLIEREEPGQNRPANVLGKAVETLLEGVLGCGE